MIFSVLVNGRITGFKVAFFFTFKTSFFGMPVIFCVRTVVFWTRTGIFLVRPLFSVIVSVVFPLFVPAFNLQVPFGFPVTVTIFVFPDFQDFTKSPGAKPVTFRALLRCLVFKTRLDIFTFIVGFDDGACGDGALDGVGIVLPEYMMAEKPIVATCVDAIPNIVRNEENGLLVEVDNAAEASEAVIRLYRNAKFKQNLVIQGIKDVHSKFDAQRVAKEHEKLFEELVR